MIIFICNYNKMQKYIAKINISCYADKRILVTVRYKTKRLQESISNVSKFIAAKLFCKKILQLFTKKKTILKNKNS